MGITATKYSYTGKKFKDNFYSNKNCPLRYQFLEGDRYLIENGMNVSEFCFLLLRRFRRSVKL